jgi:hypothetical protein
MLETRLGNNRMALDSGFSLEVTTIKEPQFNQHGSGA